MFRLFLAITVMISHSYVLGGYGPEPSLYLSGQKYTLGSICVAFFFMLSGFLIQASASSKSFKIFWRSRFLRVFPAYVFVLASCSFILAPVLYLVEKGNLNSFWLPSWNGSLSYFFKNVFFPNYLQSGIKEIFISTPFGAATGIDSMNGSLWTLPLEVRCYLIVFLFSRFGPRKNRLLILSIFTFSFFVFLNFQSVFGFNVTEKSEWALYLVFFFLLGAVVSNHKINARSFLVISSVFFFLGILLPIETRLLLILPFTLAICLLLISKFRFKVQRFYRADLSYGFYIWAWPITQSTSLLSQNQLKHLSFILVIFIQTLVLSTLSWYAVERPSLQRKSE